MVFLTYTGQDNGSVCNRHLLSIQQLQNYELKQRSTHFQNRFTASCNQIVDTENGHNDIFNAISEKLHDFVNY